MAWRRMDLTRASSLFFRCGRVLLSMEDKEAPSSVPTKAEVQEQLGPALEDGLIRHDIVLTGYRPQQWPFAVLADILEPLKSEQGTFLGCC